VKELLNIPQFIHFAIYTNNYCSFHCEHCSYKCNIPPNPANSNVWRRKKWEVSVDDLRLFCERFKGYGEKEYHLLGGGETTVVEIEKVKEYLDILSSYKRRISIRTNGYNLLGLGEHINKFSLIILSDHGINADHIKRCQKELAKTFKGKAVVESMKKHVDLDVARKEPAKKGKNCRLWIADLQLVGRILHPCCCTHPIDIWNNSTKINNELISCGWTTDNPDLIETIRNWKTTIPAYIIDQCHNNCWNPGIFNTKPENITLKKNDVIAKK